MKLAQVLAFATTLAVVVSSYDFTDTGSDKESTGLTADQESRIFGGTEVNINDYPFAVNLRIDFFDSSYCGGALIAPQWVLTAGHCAGRAEEYGITAVLGSTDRAGTKGEHIKVVKSYVHPKYKRKSHVYDIGLLKLAKPSRQKTIGLCAEDGSDNTVGTKATIVGWGITEKGEESKKLLGVEIPIISNADCNKSYRNRIKEGMMCAGKGDGKDSCNGDSGGPLVANDILVGIASWGGKCGKHPGVYTRLTYVMDYIKDILNGGDGSSFADGSTTGSAKQKVSVPKTKTKSSDSASGSLSFDFGFADGSSTAQQSKTTTQKTGSTNDATQSSTLTPTKAATKTTAKTTESSS